MFCKGCGSLLNDGASFCPKCGLRMGNQMYGTGMAAQPNVQPSAYYGNYTENANSEKTNKKKHTVPIVIASLVAVISIIGSACFFLPKLISSNDTETNAKTSSSSRKERDKTDSSLTAEKELIGYIDQSLELMMTAVNDVGDLSDYNGIYEAEAMAERFREQANILEDSLSELADIQKQADAVSGIDANLEKAKKEFFSLAQDSQKAYMEMFDFFEDYIVLAGDLDNKPEADNYNSTSDYYNDLYTWYESTKERYSAINTCPSCLASEWKKLGTILDLNYDIAWKLYLAEEYDDYLRFQSAVNMSNRYDTVIQLETDEFLDCISGEANFFVEQMVQSAKLVEEIHTYAGLKEEERSGYVFETIRTGEVSLDYDAVDTIYPSLYNTYDAFLIIKTGCISGSRKILVDAEIPGLTQSYKESFTLDTAYRTIYIKPPALTGNLDLSSAKNAQIKVTISDQDGTLIEAKTFPVTIKSKYDVEWYTDEYGVATQDNILCFLTPEASAISQLKRQAIEEISSMTGGQMESFVGYQETGWNHYVGTYLQAAGIMRALNKMGVRYNMDSYSLSGSHQHVLFPENVLEQQSGLCVETSLVVASALQSADMHAFLVFPPGHAQVAVEIWNDGEGAGEYFLIETTSLTSDSNNEDIFIENANSLLEYYSLGTGPIVYYSQKDWLDYITENTYVIDCDDSRILGLTPFTN